MYGDRHKSRLAYESELPTGHHQVVIPVDHDIGLDLNHETAIGHALARASMTNDLVSSTGALSQAVQQPTALGGRLRVADGAGFQVPIGVEQPDQHFRL